MNAWDIFPCDPGRGPHPVGRPVGAPLGQSFAARIDADSIVEIIESN